MKKLLIILALVFVGGQLYAQKAKLFINKREIEPRSVHFLDAATIDSINFYTGSEASEKFYLQTSGIDSVFVIFKRDMSDVVSYYQLLNLYHLDDRARALPLNIGMGAASGRVDNAKLMAFNLNMVQGVGVSVWRGKMELGVSSYYNRLYRSDAGKMLHWLQGYVDGYGDNAYFKQYKRR